MTARRDLKRRIRARQEKTGEGYATARTQVLAQRPAEPPKLKKAEPTAPPATPSWVLELEDVTAAARAAGIVCLVSATPTLAHAPELASVLERLRAILVGPTPGLEALQRVAVRGEPDVRTGTPSVMLLVGELRTFSIGLEQGLRGPGPTGRILAFGADVGGRDRTIIAQLLPRYQREPLLVLTIFRDGGLATLLDTFGLWAQVPGRP